MDWHRVKGIVQYQYRMGLKSWAFWIVGLALAFLTYQNMPRRNVFTTPRLTSFLYASAVGNFLPLLMCFLVAPTWRRDEKWRMADVLWAKPVNHVEYVLGTSLALLALALTLLFGSLLAMTGLLFFLHGQPPDLMSYVLFTVIISLPSLLFFTALEILLSILLPANFLVYLTSIPAWVGAVMLAWGQLRLPQTIHYLLDVIAPNVFFSNVLGWGPDGKVLLAQRFFCIALSLAMALLALLLFPVRNKQSVLKRARPSHTVWALMGIVLLPLLPLVGYLSASRELSYPAVSPSNPPEDAEWQMTISHLKVDLDPRGGQLQGEAEIALQGTASSVVLALNPGLQVLEVATAAGDRLGFSQQGSEITVVLPSLPPENSHRLRALYSGKLMVPPDVYRTYGLTKAATFQQDVPAYVGHGTAFLKREGDWYLQLAGQLHSLFSVEKLKITVPGDLTTVASTRQVQRLDNGRSLYTWQGELPRALLAVSNFQEVRLDDGLKAYMPPVWREIYGQEIFSAYARTIDFLEEKIRGRETTISLVELPLTSKVFHSDGVVFLPEGIYRNLSGGPPVARNRRTIGFAATHWWEEFLGVELRVLTQESSGGAPTAFGASWDPFLMAVSQYTAMLSADQILDNSWAEQEIALCHDFFQGAKSYSTNYHEVIEKGLEAYHLGDGMFLALHDIHQALGDDDFYSLLRTLAQEAKDHAVTASDLRNATEQLIGADKTAQIFERYQLQGDAGP